jgi:D-sedoheptulose 7-phosphate isomerase
MNKDVKKQITEIIKAHQTAVAQLQADAIGSIIAAANMIIKSLRKNGCVYTCGNGGSAADAQHIAAELVGRFERSRKGFAAIALTTDTSLLTSASNDFGFENVFVRQVEALVKKGDVLCAISTSGTSPNIVAAVKLAKKKNAKVLAFTGKKNSLLEKLADICICANSKSTARSQEIHQLAYHIICGLVENALAGQ